MAWEARSGLKRYEERGSRANGCGLNGLGSPFGIETVIEPRPDLIDDEAKWPGKPVRD